VAIEIKLLGKRDGAVLRSVAPGVFDKAIDPRLAAEFLADSRHHLVVAIDDDGLVVGFASGVHYIHPDKPAELWVNELGVAPTHRRRGVAKAVLQELLHEGQRLGCAQAWVLTERHNEAAMAVYASLGGVEDSPDTTMLTFDLSS
jgi:aminoglycoside 6'-N-acetyltransferase I